ncbi:MAG: glycosyltransferase family 2 protein [Acidobacteriota bacterium]|nr:glycosyltransferase family 2 protein [Acidobacteriota bacterium]
MGSLPHESCSVVSIGIPTHNRRDLLKRALGSALAQTWPRVEIIVADDASSDETPQFMQQFADDPRITYLRTENNLGIARNTNRCLERASGEFLIILNDDDELESEAVERLSQPFREGVGGISPERIGVSWCPCTIQNGAREVKWTSVAGPAVESGLDLVVGLFNGTRGPRFCGVMVRTADVRAVGGYDVRHGPIPDVGNWTQIAVRHPYAACVPIPVARYTAHNVSCTGTSKAQSWQVAGETIYADLASYFQSIGDRTSERRLKRSRRNFICGLEVSIIMQSMGKPGWTKLAIGEVLRVPQYFATPMVFRRLLLDGHKLFTRPS